MRTPPPEITCSFLIQLVFCKKKKNWFIGVEVKSKRRVHPLLKEILDPPLETISGLLVFLFKGAVSGKFIKIQTGSTASKLIEA